MKHVADNGFEDTVVAEILLIHTPLNRSMIDVCPSETVEQQQERQMDLEAYINFLTVQRKTAYRSCLPFLRHY